MVLHCDIICPYGAKKWDEVADDLRLRLGTLPARGCLHEKMESRILIKHLVDLKRLWLKGLVCVWQRIFMRNIGVPCGKAVLKKLQELAAYLGTCCISAEVPRRLEPLSCAKPYKYH